jgi:hypothetical protein
MKMMNQKLEQIQKIKKNNQEKLQKKNQLI